MNKLLVGLVVLLGVALVGAVVVVGLAVNRPVKVEVNLQAPLGATAGNEFDQGVRVSAFYSKDSSITDTTLTTLTAKQVCEDNLISLGSASATPTVAILPSAPLLTAECFDRPEATRTLLLRNASTALSSTIEVQAGASSSLYSLNFASSGVAQAGNISRATTTLTAGQVGKLTGVRITSSTPWILWVFEGFR